MALPVTTLTVTLDPEIKELIEGLTKELHEFNSKPSITWHTAGKGIAVNTKTGEVIESKAMSDPIPDDNCPYPDDTKVSLNPKTEPEAEPEKQEPTHTREQLQELVVKVSAAGQKEAVKTIVRKYATKVSTIPADRIDDVYAEVEALV